MCARGVSEVLQCLEITMFRMPCLPRNTPEEAPAGPAPTTSTSVSIVAPMTTSTSSPDASIGAPTGPVNTMLYVRIVFNHRPAHIISLNASAGQFPIGRKTFWLAGRLMRSFVTIYRKTQDSAYRRLHEHPGGPTEGIRVNFLGQNDA